MSAQKYSSLLSLKQERERKMNIRKTFFIDEQKVGAKNMNLSYWAFDGDC